MEGRAEVGSAFYNRVFSYIMLIRGNKSGLFLRNFGKNDYLCGYLCYKISNTL